MFDNLRSKLRKRPDDRSCAVDEDRLLGRKRYLYFNMLAVLVGLFCGVAAIGFRYLVVGMTWLFQTGNVLIHPYPWYFVIMLIPALGGLCAGLIITRWAPEAKGHGVPEVMEAMALRGGKIRPRVVGIKALASAITIGSGGSAGREGPIVHISSAMGSSIGRRLGLTTYHVKVLVGCAAAGAISATFNTPLAGIIFALELILPEIRTRSFIPVVLSSVFANVTSWSILRAIGVEEVFVFGAKGGEPLGFLFQHPMEMGFYLVLGLLAGLVAILFVRTLYSLEDIFDRLRIHPALKPAIGGLLVGVMGVAVFSQTGEFRVFGVGYESVRWVLGFGMEDLAWSLFALLGVLVLLKLLSTSFTLGSGASGGVFAPSLFMGAMLGGAVGVGVNLLPLPFEVGHPGAYALVGMAAVFAGASRATLTAIIIIFEMTGDYYIILPLMFACVVSDGVAAWISKDSIYTMKLSRRGVKLPMDRESDIMDQITVREIMHTKVETVPPDMPLGELRAKMIDTGHMGFPVVEPWERKKGKGEKADHRRKRRQRLAGIVTHRDLQAGIKSKRAGLRVKDVMTTEIVTVTRSMSLEDVLLSTGWRPLNHLPVVSVDDRRELIGFLTKGDILRAYRFRRVSLHEQCASLTRKDRRRVTRERKKEWRKKLEALKEGDGPGKKGGAGDDAPAGEEGGGKTA